MSESTIREEISAIEPSEIIEGGELQEVSSSYFGMDLSVLKSPTGAGSIEEYIDHPMNFTESRGLARIIRGLTGILGNLNLAIIDIGLGLLEFMKEKKPVKNYSAGVEMNNVNGGV